MLTDDEIAKAEQRWRADTGASQPETMTEDIVERVARAVQESAAEYRLRPFTDGWERDYVRLASERFARAALLALREPTEGMVEAALDQFDWGPPGYDDAPGGGASPQAVFTAMIDAALNEGG